MEKRAEEKLLTGKVLQSRKKILLIGHKPDALLLTAIQEKKYDIIACESPQVAWGLVFPYRPQCIIIHLSRPSRGDLALVQECRALAEGVPVIVATSVTGNEAVMKALEERATSLLSLPMNPQTIKKVLDELEAAL